jgi:hypothetical protein
MVKYQPVLDKPALDNLIQKLKQNIERLLTTQEAPLSKAFLPKSPGVYMIFFNGKLQYIGSSGNLKERIKTNLLSGDREAHTLINKLCTLKNWSIDKAHNFLKTAATIKFIETDTEDEAKILEDVLIAIYHPFYNMPLKIAKKFMEIGDFMISEENKVKDLLIKIQDIITIPGAEGYIRSTEYMVKSQEDAISVLNSGRFDITADVEYWAKSDKKKIPSKYVQIPSPVPETDTAFLVVENNVTNAGMAIEYIVQKYIGVKSFLYFAIVIPGMKGYYDVIHSIKTFILYGDEPEP